jgi:hypothetical protein
MVLIIGRQNRALSLNCVRQFDEGLGMLDDRLFVLPLEKVVVELGQEMVHVFAASVGQVLPVQQPGRKTGELHQTQTHLGVADIHKYHMPHFVQGL